MSSAKYTSPDHLEEHSSARRKVLVSTMNDVPGYRIVRVLGAVFGQTTLARGIRRNVGAELKAMAGGEIKQFTTMIQESRDSAMERMMLECSKRHGNAVIAMRFDAGTLGDTLSQACAYGTACIIERIVEDDVPPEK
jgi:uncharacterized protein YbjQ (UPF0145 family)